MGRLCAKNFCRWRIAEEEEDGYGTVRAFLVCLVAAALGGTCAWAEEPTASPSPAADIPEGYEVGEKSVSPNGRFAILYPVHNDNADLPLAKWNGNSVVVIWIARKWGMEDLAIYEIEKDEVKGVQAIWQEVRKLFDQDFRERFLKRYPDEKGSGVTFISGGEEPGGNADLEFKGRKLILNLFADNKPNLASGPHWTASLHAVWNIDKSKFEKIDFRPGLIEERPEN
jgi:hypothetical protein